MNFLVGNVLSTYTHAILRMGTSITFWFLAMFKIPNKENRKNVEGEVAYGSNGAVHVCDADNNIDIEASPRGKVLIPKEINGHAL